jgi:hypothetical protein
MRDIEIEVFWPSKQSTEDAKKEQGSKLGYYGGLCFSMDGIESGCTDQYLTPTAAHRESNLDNMITLKVIHDYKS